MPVDVRAVLVAGLAGLSDFAGSALILGGRRVLGRWFDSLLAYGTGFALAIALADLIPAGLEGAPRNALWALAGYAVLHLTTHLLKGPELADDGSDPASSVVSGPRLGPGLAMAGVILCDFFDGVTVASAASATGTTEAAALHAQHTGWLLLGGLFPHNFLEGASIALLLLGAGTARGVVWLLVALLAAASLAGGFAVVLTVPPALRAAAQAFAGGLLLHLVASERIPQFQRAHGRHARTQALLVVAGMATFALTATLL